MFLEETKLFTTEQLKVIVNLLQTHTIEKLTEVLDKEISARSGGNIVLRDDNDLTQLGCIINIDWFFLIGKQSSSLLNYLKGLAMATVPEVPKLTSYIATI